MPRIRNGLRAESVSVRCFRGITKGRRVPSFCYAGGDNKTRKERKARRNSAKPSFGLRAKFTQDGGARQL